MLDTIKTITVTLEVGIDEEYVDSFIIPGIKAMRGVASVDKEKVDSDAIFAVVNAKLELRKKLLDILNPK